MKNKTAARHYGEKMSRIGVWHWLRCPTVTGSTGTVCAGGGLTDPLVISQLIN